MNMTDDNGDLTSSRMVRTRPCRYGLLLHVSRLHPCIVSNQPDLYESPVVT